MTYKNRELIREPICMLRGSKEEREKLMRLAERLSDGGAVAPTLLDALLRLADEQEMVEWRSHVPNRSHRGGLDRNAFGALLAA